MKCIVNQTTSHLMKSIFNLIKRYENIIYLLIINVDIAIEIY